MDKKVKILNRTSVAKSRLFEIESLHLKFSNGVERHFERLKTGSSYGAVMIVAIDDNDELLLVREFGAGLEDYMTGFPKGLIDKGETVLEAANRELKEETGFGARDLTHLHTLTTSPAFFSQKMHVILARDLYEELLPGDEPEPLELIKCPLDKIDALVKSTLSDARSIAALYLARQALG